MNNRASILPMCCKRVNRRNRYCKNGGTIERNGQFYCSVHDPVIAELRTNKGNTKHLQRMRELRLADRAPAMKALLLRMKVSCTGVYTTDQYNGKTFADQINDLLEGT